MRYDATLKKLFREPPDRLLSYALGKPVTVARMLPTDLITVENLHPDLLFEDTAGELIHAEMQGYQMNEFACRNLIYCGLLLRDYKRHPQQVIFWIGRDRVGVSAGIRHAPNLDYSYTVIDVRDIDARALLQNAGVGESIFGILCKFEDKGELISEILGESARCLSRSKRRRLLNFWYYQGLEG